MSKPVIKVENLSKKYLIQHQQDSYKTFRGAITDAAKSLTKVINPRKKKEAQLDREEFWALNNVSFEIQQGDRVGIIGRNGAGKSTLLKILSRITEPTTGKIRISGRVASLLEVGTGFHPELTGRENIFLNGAILGMSKLEIQRKFDEIVAFAEIEKFLDTPVKRYSSGMYVRLAFAVAAHLEPEILIVDEVLAVGDAQFQKKCLGKMEEVGREGRTVLFVSHQMAAVEKLCQTGILLHQGSIQYAGEKTRAIAKYLTNYLTTVTSLEERKDRVGSGEVKIFAIEIKDTDGTTLDTVTSGQTVDFYFYFKAKPNTKHNRVIAGLMIKTSMEIPVFLQHNRLTQNDFGTLPLEGAFVCRIERLPLPPANYQVDYSLMKDGMYLDLLHSAIELSVISGDFYGSGEVPPISHGVCLVDAEWRLETNVALSVINK